MPHLQGQSPAHGQTFYGISSRGLGSGYNPDTGSFSPGQNRAILIVGMACASFSLVAAVIALRWFVLMRRAFRHRLILFLIASDTFKAVWYFVFPIVVFARGEVRSSSKFCQASGFFLLLAIEASDFAILLIALHAILYIFAPLSKAGEGGLYPYRKWIIPFWLGPPLLFASLAFVNDGSGYVTSGTFCQLPKRPFWYRLALSWIPRYIIISTILLMYICIYVYVHFKFKDFGNLAGADSSFDSGSVDISASRQSASFSGSTLEEGIPPNRTSIPTIAHPTTTAPSTSSKPNPESPWESMSFITARPVEPTIATKNTGSEVEDFAPTPPSPLDANGGGIPSRAMLTVHEEQQDHISESRKPSEVPTMNTSFTGETVGSHHTNRTSTKREQRKKGDPLQKTRRAILRQIRFLFVYPLIYIIMWAFPFAAHALNYDDHYVNHPVFWLIIMQTLMLSLQAGVDSVVFSWRERPWRRIDDDNIFSFTSLRRRSKAIIGGPSQKNSVAPSEDTTLEAFPQQPTVANRNSNWWEAEGRKRKDSVWMGTDTLNTIPSHPASAKLTPQRSLQSLEEE